MIGSCVVMFVLHCIRKEFQQLFVILLFFAPHRFTAEYARLSTFLYLCDSLCVYSISVWLCVRGGGEVEQSSYVLPYIGATEGLNNVHLEFIHEEHADLKLSSRCPETLHSLLQIESIQSANLMASLN